MEHDCCFYAEINAVTFCSYVNRFGVTYQGKVGDDVEVRVDGLVERFVTLVVLLLLLFLRLDVQRMPLKILKLMKCGAL